MVYTHSEDSFLNDTMKLPAVPTVDVVVQPSASDFTDSVTLPRPAPLTSYGAAHETGNMLPSPVSDVELAPLRRSRRRSDGGNIGIRARLLDEWENARARWWKFGKSSTVLPVTTHDTEPSALLQHTSSQPVDDTLDEVDEVIVDNLAQGSDSPSHSDYAAEAPKQLLDDVEGKEHPEETRQRNSTILAPYYLFRRTIWYGLHRFYATSFVEKDLERHYRQETWRISKGLGATSTLFLLINWVLCVALWPRPFNLSDRIFLYAITPIFTFPPALIIWFDFPTKRPILYQALIGVAIWSWAMYQIFYLTACGNYTVQYTLWDSGCSGRDFLGLFYWACALPTIGLFGLKMTRLTATIGAIAFISVTSVVVVPYRHTWIRNVVNFAAFNLFLLWIHYAMEQSERRLYILQDRLIVQNKQTQEAQKNERAVADSKRRLTSYVFHEVRVPLNTAVLAVQNVQASLGDAAQSHKVEFTALTGSLKQMSAVLNDILDFNRMESGKFVFVAHPFAFHTTMRSLFGPLKLSAEARKLTFVTDLDSCIDDAAIKTSSETIQGKEQNIGVFIGDEQRLRQVVTNLASNACKFTPAGGEVKLTTRLLGAAPSSSHDNRTSSDESSRHLRGQNHITVRIEVSDTGYGIRRQDMVESKLFSSFSQTEQGRLQGGKGTGLGLAIVRQIVQLAGGRLRVRSRVGHGTTFTVDMPLRLMAKDVRSPTPGLSQRPNSPPARPPISPTYPSPPTSQGSIPQAKQLGPASLAKALSDPILSPPVLHGSQSSALMSLARVQPVQPQDTPEEEAVAAHAAAGLPHPSLASPFQTSPPPSASTSRIPSESEPVPPPSPSFPAGLRALVVDDDNMTRMLMKRMLTRLGCIVQAAENGQVALEAVLAPPAASELPLPTPSSDSHRSSYGLHGPVPAPSPASSPGHLSSLPHGNLQYAVVFLDNQMPIMSGLDMVRAVRRKGVNVFVVGVTGNALLQDQQEFIEAGADHVLTKPVYERDLKRMLVFADEHRLKALAQRDAC